MLEIIMVIILVSVLAVAVVPSMMSSTYDLRAEADVLKGHIRYAQSKAMNTEEVWGIRAGSGGYSLFRGGDATNLVRFPSEQGDRVSAHIGSSSFTVSFDSWGVPHSTAPATDGSELSSNLSISLSHEGQSETVTVTKGTGFVP